MTGKLKRWWPVAVAPVLVSLLSYGVLRALERDVPPLNHWETAFQDAGFKVQLRGAGDLRNSRVAIDELREEYRHPRYRGTQVMEFRLDGTRVQILDFRRTSLSMETGVALRGTETSGNPDRPFLYYWGTMNGHRCLIYPRRRRHSPEPVSEKLVDAILDVFEKVLSR